MTESAAMTVRQQVISRLDWSRIPTGTDADRVIGRNEERLARMVAFIRLATVPFLAVPLVQWRDLPRPWIIVAALAAAVVEAGWVLRRVRRRGSIRGDWTLAVADLAFCVALMAIGSRAGLAGQRNAVLTELVPFSLVSPVILAFAVGLRARAVAGVAVLAGTWVVVILPNVTQKLGSDVLGFVVWYVAGLAVATLLRSIASETATAVGQARAAEAYALEQRRLLDLALHREAVRRSIHDGVLPIFDGIALNGRLDVDTRRAAQRGAVRARALLGGEPGQPGGFRHRMLELTETFLGLGLLLRPRVYGDADPPPDVADALLGATHEALANALKYAGEAEVVLFVDARPGRVSISVLDGGTGFDPDTTPKGGGYTASLPAVERVGAAWQVTAAPGEGTKVELDWPAEPGDD
jgi:hypothetical protein